MGKGDSIGFTNKSPAFGGTSNATEEKEIKLVNKPPNLDQDKSIIKP